MASMSDLVKPAERLMPRDGLFHFERSKAFASAVSKNSCCTLAVSNRR